jgi:hypothetical protein
MKQVAQLSEEERSELFQETANKMGIRPSAVEKDFWICWILMIIFEDPKLSNILRFKGGTSLSKCFNLIERFSEDIDLILDWNTLTDEDPEKDRSRTKQAKLNKEINSDAQEFIRDELLPMFKSLTTPHCSIEIDSVDPHTLNVNYPSSFTDEYLRSEIRLEIGPLAAMTPYNNQVITSYAADKFPTLFAQAQAQVIAIDAERTFWEKITILHAEAHRPNQQPPIRYSRHYYDVYQMIGTDIEANAVANEELLLEVVEFKKKFYPSGWAHYDQATNGSFKFLPSDESITFLQSDYKAMEEMIFGDHPSFDQIINRIRELEQRLNQK